MMDIWGVLQIAETDDKKTIRRAYAKLLKKYQKLQDSNALLELNEAYTEALVVAEESILTQNNFVKETEVDFPKHTMSCSDIDTQKITNTMKMEFDIGEEGSAEFTGISEDVTQDMDHIWDENHEEDYDSDSAADEILQSLLFLNEDLFYWNSFSAWKEILNNESMQSQACFQDVKLSVLLTLACHMYPLSDGIPPLRYDMLLVLDRYFGWSECEIDLYQQAPQYEDELDQFLALINFAKTVEQKCQPLPEIKDWPELDRQVVENLMHISDDIEVRILLPWDSDEKSEDPITVYIDDKFKTFQKEYPLKNCRNKKVVKEFVAVYLYNKAIIGRWPWMDFFAINSRYFYAAMNWSGLTYPKLKKHLPKAIAKQCSKDINWLLKNQGKGFVAIENAPFNVLNTVKEEKSESKTTFTHYMWGFLIVALIRVVVRKYF